MKIAFLTTLNPEDTNTWSGTSYTTSCKPYARAMM